jgi:hypothetical protein
MICDECETVAHCTKHGCIPKQPEYKDAIEVSVIFHEGQRMFAVPKQPAQHEPVAWWDANLGVFDEKHFDQLQPLYTSPPAQRTWVGLEKSDMPDGADPLFDDPKFIAGMVYAANKLMEKNT